MTDPLVDHSLVDLTGELRYLLNRWDPIGIDDELGPILARLARGDSRAAFSEYLRNEIQEHFGLDPAGCGSDAAADRLRAWYGAKNARS
jgi:hypothetical protein